MAWSSDPPTGPPFTDPGHVLRSTGLSSVLSRVAVLGATSPRMVLPRFLERVQVRDLVRTRDWIRQEEQHLAELAARQPPPAWVVEQGIGQGRRPVAVHQGFCRPTGPRVKAVAADESQRLLDDESALACQLCRPDTELGMR